MVVDDVVVVAVGDAEERCSAYILRLERSNVQLNCI